MLTPGAEINHRPELEIYADDVKCGHGAAIGTLDENQLFYMQSRGIPAAEARQLLVSAYFADLTGRVPDAMREDVDTWVASRMTHAGGAA
jgi:Fe-S cluster assembly protein SufD